MNINELLDKCINEKLIDLTISNVKKKGGEIAVKVKIRPVILKDELVFQVSEFIGQKVYHKNVRCNEVKKLIIKLITDVYKQAQFNMTDASAQVLSGNNGNLTIKYKRSAKQKEQKDLSHNRSKKYILKEGVPVGF